MSNKSTVALNVYNKNVEKRQAIAIMLVERAILAKQKGAKLQ